MQTLQRLFAAACCFLLISIQARSQDDPPGSCLPKPLCSYYLCDTCLSSLPFSSVGKDLNIKYGKYDSSFTYPGDIRYKTENDITCNSNLSTAFQCRRDSTGDLRYDVYYPLLSGNAYDCAALPVIISVHGGAFSDCINKPNIPGNNPDGTAFALRGFIFVDVEYRTGRRVTPDEGNYPYITVQQQLAVYRPMQDVIGAIRSVILRQRLDSRKLKANRKPYRIDTTRIFLAGNSAGAITVLGVAYYTNDAMIDALNPHSGSVSIKDALGPLNADYYYGDTTIRFRSAIKGVAAQWGSLSVPYTYDSTNAKNFFDQKIPVIAFHGLLDTTVNPYVDSIDFAPSNLKYGTLYSTETSCLITSSFQTKQSSGTMIHGQYAFGTLSYVRNILQPLNIRYEAYEDCTGGHGLATGGPFYADYGTGYTNPAQVRLYITGRVATFFQSLLSGIATLPTNKVFVDCPNYTVGCAIANNDGGCSNTDTCGSH